MSNEEKTTWIIATCNSDGDGVWMDKIEATEKEVKEKLASMVCQLHGEDPECWDSGTERVEDILAGSSYGFANFTAMNASAQFYNYHVDISAIRLSDIPMVQEFSGGTRDE